MPLIGDFVPGTGRWSYVVAFTMMALGLNIVVGYAGLLDLGYVAFYAVRRVHRRLVRLAAVRRGNILLPLVRCETTSPGIHITMWLVLLMARAI